MRACKQGLVARYAGENKPLFTHGFAEKYSSAFSGTDTFSVDVSTTFYCFAVEKIPSWKIKKTSFLGFLYFRA